MASTKRKPHGLGLERRVRPRIEPEPDIEEVDASSEASRLSAEPDSDVSGEDSGPGQDSDGESDSEASSAGDVAKIDTSQLSFGALARAQASLSSSSKGRDDGEALAGGREPGEGPQRPRSRSAAERARAKRSSKHAPTEMTSKKPVSRRRDIVEVQRVQPRDPRFAPLGAPVDEVRARRAYAFLDEYRDDEMKKLRAAAKKTKDAAAREQLQGQLKSMESRKKAQDRKDRERAIIEEHRRQEKEQIKLGKKPFYLKKSEQKKRLLMDQYANMNKRQVDKLIERRRKKAVGKEKKTLPMFRRGAES